MKIFKSVQFGAVRTMGEDRTNEVVFNANDVCTALRYKNARNTQRSL